MIHVSLTEAQVRALLSAADERETALDDTIDDGREGAGRARNEKAVLNRACAALTAGLPQRTIPTTNGAQQR